MGKLNYTNRKISGEKLGAAVKRDVLKCIVQAAKPSRFPRDPHIELNLQGKSLCDEGLKLACEGLTKTLESGSTKLDELNLSENSLTLAGLRRLTEVIKLASRDLKDLDLRRNNIQIRTEEDARIWENFLTGFRDVCSLRRLDISENPLGDRGIEILLSVYARESPLILPRAAGYAVTESSDEDYETDFEEEEEEEEETNAVLSSKFQQMSLPTHQDFPESPPSLYSTPSKSTKSCSDDHCSSTLSPSTSLASGAVEIHGLRSIPYLIISKTELSDKAALFLSYILPVHPAPDRLLCYLPPTRPGFQAEILDRYDHSSGCSGIVYHNNEQFTIMGLKVLELAENIRDVASSPTAIFARSRQASDASSTPSTPLKPRRESLSSPTIIHSPYANCGNGMVSELERARSKIQGALLKDSGIGSIELWKTTLRMLATSRTILFDKENTGTEYFSSPRRNSHYSPPMKSSLSAIYPVSFGLPMDSSNFSQNVHHAHTFDAPPAWNELSSTQVGGSTLRKDTSDPLSPTQALFSSSDEAAKSEETQLKGLKDLPGGLPEDIWVRIITLATDPRNILSAKQRRNVVTWAKASDTLERERELGGKLKSVQIWRLLEGLECLGCEV